MFNIIKANDFLTYGDKSEYPNIISSQLPILKDGTYIEQGNPEGPCFTVQSNILYDSIIEMSKFVRGRGVDCLEIGRRNGWSTRMILSAFSKVDGHLDSIDVSPCDIKPLLSEEEKNHYTQICSRCQDYKFQKTYDFVFIDTWHRYKETLEEIEVGWPLLNTPGILIVHKCESHFNCKKAVFDWAQKNMRTFCFDSRGQGMAMFVKPNYPLKLRDRSSNDNLSNETYNTTN